MKDKFKKYIQGQLEAAVRTFFTNHPRVKLIAVAGSVGKTSTKMATVHVLETRYRVLVHRGNFNTELSVPLTILDLPLPESLYSPVAWFQTLRQAREKAKASTPFPYDVIVVELGTDKPGDIPHFGTYLRPDLSVVTAVSPEHMEFFKTIEAVAREELAVSDYSGQLLVNRDDIEESYSTFVKNPLISTYGIGGVAEYHFLPEQTKADGSTSGKFVSPEYGEQQVDLKVIGEHSVKPLIAAGAVAIKFGLNPQEIRQALEDIIGVPGRMQVLRGIHDSMIIDDSYNASPLATAAALQTLYSLQDRQRIAILGSMNELGEVSQQEHERIGKLCDNSLLEWVVTIGSEAEKYLAPAAKSRGCQVRSFMSAYDAGSFVRGVLQPGAAVLVKGSQNGVFAEEAIKLLLHSIDDESKLVRQSPDWQQAKAQYFDKFKSSK
ncbi:hypothetical protein JNJ66_02475 [Candidatus Saccharibacteria bacterium]|nr:hypothetical protein [Candidatus Saccharibacteria bacterium]